MAIQKSLPVLFYGSHIRLDRFATLPTRAARRPICGSMPQPLAPPTPAVVPAAPAHACVACGRETRARDRAAPSRSR